MVDGLRTLKVYHCITITLSAPMHSLHPQPSAPLCPALSDSPALMSPAPMCPLHPLLPCTFCTPYTPVVSAPLSPAPLCPAPLASLSPLHPYTPESCTSPLFDLPALMSPAPLHLCTMHPLHPLYSLHP